MKSEKSKAKGNKAEKLTNAHVARPIILQEWPRKVQKKPSGMAVNLRRYDGLALIYNIL